MKKKMKIINYKEKWINLIEKNYRYNNKFYLVINEFQILKNQSELKNLTIMNKNKVWNLYKKKIIENKFFFIYNLSLNSK